MRKNGKCAGSSDGICGSPCRILWKCNQEGTAPISGPVHCFCFPGLIKYGLPGGCPRSTLQSTSGGCVPICPCGVPACFLPCRVRSGPGIIFRSPSRVLRAIVGKYRRGLEVCARGLIGQPVRSERLYPQCHIDNGRRRICEPPNRPLSHIERLEMLVDCVLDGLLLEPLLRKISCSEAVDYRLGIGKTLRHANYQSLI